MHIEQSGNQPLSRGLSIAWALAGMALVAPLMAMPFTDEVHWTGEDLMIAGILLFGSLGIYTWAVRSAASAAYRAGLGVALGAAVLTFAAIGAVGITDTAADGLLLGVIALGFAGALMTNGRAQGMAWVMAATALGLAIASGAAWITGHVAAHNSMIEIFGVTGVLAALFIESALCFRRDVSRQV